MYKDNLMAAPEYAVLDAWYKWLIENVDIESDLISMNYLLCLNKNLLKKNFFSLPEDRSRSSV